MKKSLPFTFYLLYFAAASFTFPFIILYLQGLKFSGPQIGFIAGLMPLVSLVGATFWTRLGRFTTSPQPGDESYHPGSDPAFNHLPIFKGIYSRFIVSSPVCPFQLPDHLPGG